MQKLLIVESETKLRDRLKSEFEDHYQVLATDTHAHALELAIQHTPDAVISDIKASERNGTNLYDTIKSNPLTSEIPVILMSSEEMVSQGMPFLKKTERKQSIGEMLFDSRLDQLDTSPKPRGYLRTQSLPTNGYINTAPYQQFLERLEAALESRHADSRLRPEGLATSMGMSLRSFQRKIKEVFQSSPARLITQYRMQRAETLLMSTRLTITEVGFAVGFENPSSFSHSFKSHSGSSPLEYRNEYATRTSMAAG
ncbi:MAG: response regulator transcription factor [Opitutales bacterium]